MAPETKRHGSARRRIVMELTRHSFVYEIRRQGDRAPEIELALHVAMLFLDARNRIAAERKTCRGPACRCKLNDHFRKPLWIAGLLIIHCRGERTHLSHCVCIVVDSYSGAVQRAGTEKVRPEISGLDDGGMDTERRKLNG